MHNHVANRGRKALLKQIFSVFLIFTLYFNSFNNAYAATVGGWSIGGLVADGASSIANGTKQVIIDGKNYIKKGTAKITPTASQVSKVLARGAAGYALSVAVEQLIGSVDWVLDPANNQIKWSEKTEVPVGSAYWQVQTKTSTISAADACQNYLTSLNQGGNSYYKYTFKSVGSYYNVSPDRKNFDCIADMEVRSTGEKIQEPSTFQGALVGQSTVEEKDEKTKPLDVVAQQVISNAESGDANAQVATTAAAQDIINEAEQDETKARPIVQQLEASASIENADSTAQEAANDATGTQTKNPTNPDVTDISLEFPVFCGWAPVVCEAAQTVISFPQTLSNWWTTATNSILDAWTWTKAQYEASVTSISDFFKNEPDQTDNNDLPVQEIPTPQLETNAFTATAGCPEPIPIQIKIGVEGTAQISYEPICQFAEKWSFIAPLIGFLSGAMIIVGVGRKGEDSEI